MTRTTINHSVVLLFLYIMGMFIPLLQVQAATYSQAFSQFKEGHYQEALTLFEALQKEQLNRLQRSKVIYYQAKSLYFLQRYEEATKQLKAGLLQAHDRSDYYFLLGKIDWDSEQFDKSVHAFQQALKAASWLTNTDEIRDHLARAYEELAFESWLQGQMDQSRRFLEQALETLTGSREARWGTMRHDSPMRHRIIYLQEKLKRHPEIGRSFKENPQVYTKDALFNLARASLSNEDAKKLKYPFEIDEPIREYVRTHIAQIPSELGRARKIFRLFLSESGLRVKELYDTMLYKDKKDFFLGRTAQDVFHEFYPGIADYGYDPEIQYRFGDCESQSNLFVALAREAGLNAFIVRLFADIDNGYVGQHRGVGILTQDERLIIIDLSWYFGFDAPFTEFRVLDDKEDFSYYLTGFNTSGEDANPFFEAALNITPDNEVALIEMAEKAIRAKEIEKAQSYLARVPENAKGYSAYWTALADLEVLKGDKAKALEILRRSETHIKNSPTIYARIGRLNPEFGNDDEALHYLKKAAESYVLGRGNYWREIGDIEFERGRLDDAMTTYREALQDGTLLPMAKLLIHQKRGQIYQKQGNFRRALSAYAEAMALEPALSGLNRLIFLLSTREKLNTAILNVVDQAIEGSQDVLFTLRLKRLSHPELPVLAIAEANILLAQGDTKRASALIEETAKNLKLNKRWMVRILSRFNKYGELDAGISLIAKIVNATSETPEKLWLVMGNTLTDIKSAEEAIKWYRKAAEAGLKEAQFKLGVAYYFGLGTSINYIVAAHWYRKAAEQGHATAQYNLGVSYANGQGVEKDQTEALKWYRKAAEQGDASAQYNLGVNYANGQGVEKNEAEAVKWYRKAAEQGHATAQTNLGWMYANGQGVEKDDVKAVKWYRKAAEQGYAMAQYSLGLRSANGRGVEKDQTEAFKWFRKAAEQGYARAQYSLGVMYANGRGVEKDQTEALKWFRNAAEQGYATAQTKLGWMYANGRGVEKDQTEAVKWFRKAAEQGYARAQNNLGLMYANGWGVEKDIEAAIHWYRQSHQTDPDSIFPIRNLANLYRDLQRWEEANAAYKAALAISPVELSTVKAVFKNYEAQNDITTGLVRLETVVATQENPTTLWKQMGRTAFEHKQYERAIDYWKRALLSLGDDTKLRAELLYKIGTAFEPLKQQAQAEKYYRQSLAEMPDDVRTLLALAQLLRQNSRWAEAKPLFNKALILKPLETDTLDLALDAFGEYGEIEPAFRLLEPIIQKIDSPQWHWVSMANAAWNNQRFDKRLNYLEAALGFSEVRAALLSDIAGTLVILNRKDEAETYYRKAIAENPAAEYHYQYFAQMLQQQTRWKEADEVLSDFARQHPESPMIKRIRGDYYKSRGDWNRARQLYQDALAQEKNIDVYVTLYNMSSEHERQAIVEAFRQAFPDSPFRYILSAYLQANNNRKQQALSKIRAGLKRFPDDIDLVYHGIKLILAYENMDEAQALLNANVWPLTKNGLYALVQARWQIAQRVFDNAKVTLQQVPVFMADDRISWLVFLLQEQSKFKKANEVLEDFIQQYPNNRPDHLWELVEINLLLGKNEQARVYFEEHRRYYPNNYYTQILSLHPSLMTGEPRKSDATIRQQALFQRSHLKNWYGFSSSFLDAIGLIK